ncbi:MAG: NmrA family NAD(P)-binding protein [Ignavibacteriae bacterium]|nr:NmrA family NAD(P)-binding protein [Ignavibacteriota bacterium]
MKDKILIIGASGSIGLEVAHKLIDKNLPVKIAVRDPEKAQKMNLKNTEFVKFDYFNSETFSSTFENVQKLLLVSPPSYFGIQDNVMNAIDSAIQNGVELIVNISAISIESELDKPMKLIEDHIMKSKIPFVFIHPNVYMQNFNEIFRDFIVSEEEISIPTDSAKVSFVDVRDVADVAVQALLDDKLKNNTYSLTGKQALNLHVVSYLFSEALGKEIKYKNISEDVFEKLLQSANWPSGTIKGTLQLCSHIKNDEIDFVTDDIQKILNKEPIKFQQFINDYLYIWK